MSLVGLVVAFLLNAFIINALIKQPAGGQMGFGKACLVTLIEYIIEIVLCVVLFFVFGTALIGMIGMGAGAMPGRLIRQHCRITQKAPKWRLLFFKPIG